MIVVPVEEITNQYAFDIAVTKGTSQLFDLNKAHGNAGQRTAMIKTSTTVYKHSNAHIIGFQARELASWKVYSDLGADAYVALGSRI